MALSAAAHVEAQAAIDHARDRLRAALATRCESGPVVLTLDDAQHLDPPSRAALAWVAAHCDDLPVALWLFAHDEARDALGALSPAQVTRSLGPLDPTSAPALLRHALPDAPAVDLDALAGRADGNPFVLKELARMYRDEGGGADALPVSVEALLQARLYPHGAVGAAAAQARGDLRAAGVGGGRGGARRDVAALPSLREAGLVALEALAAAGVSGVRGAQGAPSSTWRTRSGPTRAGPSSTRARRPGSTAARAPSPWRSSPATGTSPETPAAPPAATPAPPRPPLAPATPPPRRPAWPACSRSLTTTRSAGGPWWRRTRRCRSTAPRRRARRASTRSRPSPRGSAYDAMAEAAWRRCYAPDHARPRRRAPPRRAGDRPRGGGLSRLAALAHMELSLLAANEGRFAAARAHAERAAGAAQAAGDAGVGARAAATRGYVLSESGDDAGACALLDAAAGAYRALGDVRREAIQRGDLGFLQLRLGRFDDARVSIDAAIVGAARVGNSVTLGVGRQNLATLLRALGHLAEARRELDLADRLAREVGFARLAEAVAVERCLLALARRAPAEESPRVRLATARRP